MALIHGPTKKQIPFTHLIMDTDAFITDIVYFWVVKQVYIADLVFKREEMAKLGTELADDKEFGLMSPGKKQDIEQRYNSLRSSVTEIENVLELAEHAYNFAELESRWGKYMRENGLIETEERTKFLQKVFKEELEIKE